MRARDPALRRPRVRSPLHEVAQAEYPVLLPDLKLGERPAKRREVPVDIADREVPAPAVAFACKAD